MLSILQMQLSISYTFLEFLSGISQSIYSFAFLSIILMSPGLTLATTYQSIYDSVWDRCGLDSTIWRQPMGNMGACNTCDSDRKIMNTEDMASWTCHIGSIALNLSQNEDPAKCLSWTTAGTCEFRQKHLKGLQVDLESEGCNGLWVAPLWITPRTWATPQHATGEIDVFERGCQQSHGFVLSLGERDPWIKSHAWNEEYHPIKHTQLTALMTFDYEADIITTFVCPFGADPLSYGVSQSQCV